MVSWSPYTKAKEQRLNAATIGQSHLSVPGKVFAHVLLARIQPLLDLTRRPEQSGFVAGRSTMDAILALRLLSDLHREFDRPLNVAYLDIKAAFDSVDRLALWKALRSRGVPDVLLDLIVALHQGTGVQVRKARTYLNAYLRRQA